MNSPPCWPYPARGFWTGVSRCLIEAFGYVGIQYPFGFLVDEDIDCANRSPRGASWSKTIAVRLQAGFPFGFERGFDQCLQCAVVHSRNAQGPGLLGAGFWNPHPTNRFSLRGEVQGVGQCQSLVGG